MATIPQLVLMADDDDFVGYRDLTTMYHPIAIEGGHEDDYGYADFSVRLKAFIKANKPIKGGEDSPANSMDEGEEGLMEMPQMETEQYQPTEFVNIASMIRKQPTSSMQSESFETTTQSSTQSSQLVDESYLDEEIEPINIASRISFNPTIVL
jgi:hypothetical protein